MVHPVDAVTSFFGGGSKATPAPTVNIPSPPGLTPAQSPTAKPARKTSMQQTFLSGAAAAQQAGAAPGQGKTLIGA